MEERIKLADGKDWTISTLDVGDLIAVEKRFGTTEFNTAKIQQVIYWVYLSLRKKHEDITEEKLYKLIDMPFVANKGIDKLFDALSKVNEWDKISPNEISPAEKE